MVSGHAVRAAYAHHASGPGRHGPAILADRLHFDAGLGTADSPLSPDEVGRRRRGDPGCLGRTVAGDDPCAQPVARLRVDAIRQQGTCCLDFLERCGLRAIRGELLQQRLQGARRHDEAIHPMRVQGDHGLLRAPDHHDRTPLPKRIHAATESERGRRSDRTYLTRCTRKPARISHRTDALPEHAVRDLGVPRSARRTRGRKIGADRIEVLMRGKLGLIRRRDHAFGPQFRQRNHAHFGSGGFARAEYRRQSGGCHGNRRDHGSETSDRKSRDEILVSVRRPHANRVTGTDAVIPKASRDRVDRAFQHRVGNGLARMQDHRLSLRRRAGVLAYRIGDVCRDVCTGAHGYLAIGGIQEGDSGRIFRNADRGPRRRKLPDRSRGTWQPVRLLSIGAWCRK